MSVFRARLALLTAAVARLRRPDAIEARRRSRRAGVAPNRFIGATRAGYRVLMRYAGGADAAGECMGEFIACQPDDEPMNRDEPKVSMNESSLGPRGSYALSVHHGSSVHTSWLVRPRVEYRILMRSRK